MGNSFGYLDPPSTDRFLAAIAGALRPGARLVIDAATVAESLLPHVEQQGRDRHEAGDVVLDNEHDYDVVASTLVTRMVLERGGERAARIVRHRVMTCREVVDQLARAGFRIDRIDGGLDGEPFVIGAGRCLVVAVRGGDDAPG
jgi:O-methyltransferase involved in polyketide biosynthesis